MALLANRSMRYRDPAVAESIMVLGDGPLPSRVMFVGMRPGKDEPWHKPYPRPFVGMAGQELDRYLLLAGLRREDVYVTNLVKNWAVGDEEPTEEEIRRDEPTLWGEIAACSPEVIIPLGAVSTRYFLGDWATMEVVHGIPHTYEAGFAVFPIFHPAAGLHDPEAIQFIVDDFERLGKFLRDPTSITKPTDQHPNPVYTVIRDPEQIWQHYNEAIAIDTEGWRGDPICLQYSRFAGEGRLVYSEDKRLLERLRHVIDMHEGIILLHNSLHDLEVCRELGVVIPEGRFADTMVWAYLLCLEPQGLKALAYRLAGMEMKDYDEVVGPASRQHALLYVKLLGEYDWGPADEYVIIESVNGQLIPKIKKPHSLNRRVQRILNDYATKGDGVDVRKRWTNMVADNPGLVAKVHELVGPMPIATLRDVPEKERITYACRDADATIRAAPILSQRIFDMGLDKVAALDHAIIPMVDRMQHIGVGVDCDHLSRLGDRCTAEMEAIQGRIKEATGAWINPNSGEQCADLLFTQLRLPWTKFTKSHKRPKCDDKVLEGLRGAHPAVSLITDYRERSKIKDSFCGPIVEAAIRSRDRRVHCNLRITRVSSGRLAANSPNLLAIPVRSDLGLEVRKGFVAGPGRVLAEWDLDQIEMREMAHQSGDPGMLKLFREAEHHPKDRNYDIHYQTASMVFGRKPDDISSFMRTIAKRVGFGVITGIQGAGLNDQIQMALALLPDEERARQEKWDEDRCDRVIEEYFKTRPHVRAFMEACRCEARRYGYVRDRWGRIRYLPGVHSRITKVRAEAERQSHSFKISASAQGVMKSGMRLAWAWIKDWWKAGVWVEPLLQVHDSLLVEMDAGVWDVMDMGMRSCFSNEADPTFSVPIKAKGGYGPTWGDLEK